MSASYRCGNRRNRQRLRSRPYVPLPSFSCLTREPTPPSDRTAGSAHSTPPSFSCLTREPTLPGRPDRRLRPSAPSVILVLDTGTHAPGDRTAHYAPTPPSVILVLDTGIHAPLRPDRPLHARAPPPTSAPPPDAPIPLTCFVEARRRTPRNHLAPAPQGRRLDLRVNVAKCRKMSHFFRPPLGDCRTLRVRNLTFLAKTRPFWPISVHFMFSRRHARAHPLGIEGRAW